MKTAIFIKSYPKDYEWLTFCLKSIQKYCTGFSEIVLALPFGEKLPLTKEKIVNVQERGIGYYWQMVVKINADKYTDADAILYVDSDCVFTRPFDASEMLKNGKPMLLRRPWGEAGEGVVWRDPAERALGFKTEHDTMCCHPSIYLRSTLQNLRAHIKSAHGVELEDYALREMEGGHKFIEFVTVGNFIIHKEPEKYSIIEDGSGDYPKPISQGWSWGGMSAEKRAELDRITR